MLLLQYTTTNDSIGVGLYTSSPVFDLKPVILHRNDPSGAAWAVLTAASRFESSSICLCWSTANAHASDRCDLAALAWWASIA